ncbi:MAG: DUF3024 domain-containing protein [Saprospiraceae bacterium]
MAIDLLTSLDFIEEMENYLLRNRPPEHIRPEVDIGYRIENQSIIILEIRPAWNNPNEIRERPVAKTTYVKSTKVWKVYWMRASGKWYLYETEKPVMSLKRFIRELEVDPYGCFWG